jgi:UDP-N-acetylglucosamine--N-acetylmuramyl-(pentapeptide) pyrophosphoryl-undecaprenol N-acetylglucosamine transferase
MGRYFPEEKVINTGNPVRNIILSEDLKHEARIHFKIKTDNPVLFIMGGSLGARTVNEALLTNINRLAEEPVEVIWQTGKYYFQTVKKQLEGKKLSNIRIMDFVARMDLAYNVADLVVSRAGALSLSELCLVGKPSVLVPSPNVAEDHQTKNALALTKAGAAIMVRDQEAKELLIETALELLIDENKLKELGQSALKLAKPQATGNIVNEVERLMK